MEPTLNEFVTQTILEVLQGIANAQRTMKKDYAEEADPNITIGTRPKERVEFDISITTSQTGETSGGGGIAIKVLDFGLKGVERKEQSAVNKIRFGVEITVQDINNYPTTSRR